MFNKSCFCSIIFSRASTHLKYDGYTRIRCKTLYEIYEKDVTQPVTQVLFTRKLHKLFPNMTKKHIRIQRAFTYCYVGLCLVPVPNAHSLDGALALAQDLNYTIVEQSEDVIKCAFFTPYFCNKSRVSVEVTATTNGVTNIMVGEQQVRIDKLDIGETKSFNILKSVKYFKPCIGYEVEAHLPHQVWNGNGLDAKTNRSNTCIGLTGLTDNMTCIACRKHRVYEQRIIQDDNKENDEPMIDHDSPADFPISNDNKTDIIEQLKKISPTIAKNEKLLTLIVSQQNAMETPNPHLRRWDERYNVMCMYKKYHMLSHTK